MKDIYERVSNELELLRDYRPFNRSPYGGTFDADLSTTVVGFVAQHLKQTNSMLSEKEDSSVDESDGLLVVSSTDEISRDVPEAAMTN